MVDDAGWNLVQGSPFVWLRCEDTSEWLYHITQDDETDDTVLGQRITLSASWFLVQQRMPFRMPGHTTVFDPIRTQLYPDMTNMGRGVARRPRDDSSGQWLEVHVRRSGAPPYGEWTELDG